MRLTRFCSRKEYEAFLRGETLTNRTVHRMNGYNTSAVGFCFTPDEPEVAVHYLSGIVNLEVCMVVEIDPSLVNKHKGQYRDPVNVGLMAGVHHKVMKPEHCLQSYDNKMVKLISADFSFAKRYPPYWLTLLMRAMARR